MECVGSYSESPSEEPILVYRPCSPLSLAISAILALVPHPQDPEPSSPVSVTRRRTYAHAFSQLATAKVESDCELQDSSTDPAQALSNDRPQIGRAAFHPRTPVTLEAVLALLILSIYEYTQRGNLLKMRYRSGQALAIALDMNLHALSEEHDDFAEARRRAWWMTVGSHFMAAISAPADLSQYYCVLQGSIVSTTVSRSLWSSTLSFPNLLRAWGLTISGNLASLYYCERPPVCHTVSSVLDRPGRECYTFSSAWIHQTKPNVSSLL